MAEYKLDTYRDGGTVSVRKDGEQIYCIQRPRGSVDPGAVYPCYPSRGEPISTKEECDEAEEAILNAVSSYRAPNEVIMVGKAISWIYDKRAELEREADAAKLRAEITLLPCPFCGGEADIAPVVPPTIRCTKCSAEYVVGISSTMGMTIDCWNTRVTDDA